jgi:nucleoid DNA-binding protein
MMELFAPEAIENIKSGMGELGSGAFVIRSIAKYFDFEVEDVAKIVDGFWAYVVDGKNYNWNVRGSLVIPNFGSFFIKKLKARTAINPQTLEKLKIRGGYRMSFKMSPSIKLCLRDPFPERSIQSKFTGASWTSKWNGKGLTHLSRKRQIAVVVQQYAGTPLYKTSLVLDSLYDVIICETYKRPLSFFKRGTFTKRAYRAKYGVNPQTGEKIMFKASQKLSFKPSKILKRNLVNTR